MPQKPKAHVGTNRAIKGAGKHFGAKVKHVASHGTKPHIAKAKK